MCLLLLIKMLSKTGLRPSPRDAPLEAATDHPVPHSSGRFQGIPGKLTVLCCPEPAGFLFCVNVDPALPSSFFHSSWSLCTEVLPSIPDPAAWWQQLQRHPESWPERPLWIQGLLCAFWPDGRETVALAVPSPGTAYALLLPQWSEDVCAAHLTQRDGYQATTQGQLKERLYQEIIHYFDKGKVKKKNADFLVFSSVCAPSCSVVNTFFNTWCLWYQKFVTDCVSEGFMQGPPAGASK